MLQVIMPSGHESSKRYIVSTLLQHFLGIDFHLSFHDSPTCYIVCDKKRLLLPDCFFSLADRNWLQAESLPREPLMVWHADGHPLSFRLVDSKIPVVFGVDPNNPDFFSIEENSLHLGLDIFGSCFYLLTRYEEIVQGDRDSFGRFPASASLAFRSGFLDRPLVNEYLEVLWSCLKFLWPDLQRKKRCFRFCPTHDVDRPYVFTARSVLGIAREFAVRGLRRGSVSQRAQMLRRFFRVRGGDLAADPANTFSRLMDTSERHGLQSTFYFICGNSGGARDGEYSIEHPYLRDLLRSIHSRGHRIGLHPSFESFRNPEKITQEFDRLQKVCIQEGICQERWGSRQHYLRLAVPETMRALEQAGAAYDSTLGFADRAGFRAGVCYEYPLFDITEERVLDLMERPLIAMECTLLDERYMNLGMSEQAFSLLTQLKSHCRLFDGDFVLLWHNSRLETESDFAFYERLFAG